MWIKKKNPNLHIFLASVYSKIFQGKEIQTLYLLGNRRKNSCRKTACGDQLELSPQHFSLDHVV